MARKERTTALPRARQRTAAPVSSRRTLNERSIQLGVIGAAVIGLLAVLAFFAYSVYDSRVGFPSQAVLRVGDQKFSLRYYTDRLGPWLQENANSTTSLAVLEENLLTKLEDEALTLLLAEEAGIDLSDEAVTQFIADGLGVPVGGSGSSFDTLYRSQLRTLGYTDGDYRRVKKAELADAKLKEQIEIGVGTTGDLYTLRVILLADQESATNIFGRIEAGEDMGTLAQVESLDLESRQNDGILLPEPLELFPEAVRGAMEGAESGTLLGPVQAGDNWWVFRVESVEEDTYSVAQLDQLVALLFEEQLNERRAALIADGDLDRSLDSEDIDWAEEHVKIPETGG
jgi:parvulin-like peptidyl-prolyl isomerase